MAWPFKPMPKAADPSSEEPLPVSSPVADPMLELMLMLPLDAETASYQNKLMRSKSIARCNRCRRVANAPPGARDCPYCCGILF